MPGKLCLAALVPRCRAAIQNLSNDRRAMSTPQDLCLRTDTNPTASFTWLTLLKRLGIWGLFLLAIYLARDFFFTAFMTFLFSYLTLTLVGFGMRRLSPGQERPGLRRLLTVGVFLLGSLILLGFGILVAPR